MSAYDEWYCGKEELECLARSKVPERLKWRLRARAARTVAHLGGILLAAAGCLWVLFAAVFAVADDLSITAADSFPAIVAAVAGACLIAAAAVAGRD